MFPKLVIGDWVIKVPIIQGGMGVKISGPKLASAVANEDGVGVLAGPDIGADEPDFFTNPTNANVRALRKAIEEARRLTTGFGYLGVNVMVALKDFAILVQTAIEEGVDFIFCGAGIAKDLPVFLKNGAKTKLIPIVSSGRLAGIIAKAWFEKYGYIIPAVVVEGPKAGGHLGFNEESLNDPEYSLEKLIPQVVDVLRLFREKYKIDIKIPAIAAGGIYTGEDIYRIMQLGASGVQMATRFVTTEECDADDKFKMTYINAKSKEDLIIIKSPVGMPGRAIRNKFLEAVAEGKRVPNKCTFHCLKTCKPQEAPYCISLALINAYRGKLEGGFAFAGENAWRAEKIISVRQLIETLKEEYENVFR